MNVFEWALLLECIGKGFTIEMHLNSFNIEMQKKRIYYRNVMEKSSTIELHEKSFYYRNTLEWVLR